MDVLSKRYVKDGNSVTRNIAGETIIVPVRSGIGEMDSIYTLNEVGTRIWQMLDAPALAEQIIRVIADEYDITESEAAADVSEFLASLEARGLIRQVI
jgi:hypothetical protein